MSKLQGKTALITGGSRGIGAAIAGALAAEGANIAITYVRSEDAAQKVVAACRDRGVKAIAIRADAASVEDNKSLVDKVVREFGQLDILVNNAGILPFGALEDCTDEDFEKTVNINIRAVFLTARAAAKVMSAGSRIINISSAIAESAQLPNIGFYTMSKFAVAGFSRAWARDLGPKGITVNCVQPGPIATDMIAGGVDDVLVAKTSLVRAGEAEEVAKFVVFLASPESAYITGACLNIDGGYSA